MKTLLLILTLTASSFAEELWKGTLHLAGGKTMTGVIEDVSPTAIKFVSQGTAYWLKIADLPAATRGELGIGTDADKAAYTADPPRRQALLDAERAKARAAREQAASNARVEARVLEIEQARRDQKQAEMRAFQAREDERRRTQALEQIALELQLRRLNGSR